MTSAPCNRFLFLPISSTFTCIIVSTTTQTAFSSFSPRSRILPTFTSPDLTYLPVSRLPTFRSPSSPPSSFCTGATSPPPPPFKRNCESKRWTYFFNHPQPRREILPSTRHFNTPANHASLHSRRGAITLHSWDIPPTWLVSCPLSYNA